MYCEWHVLRTPRLMSWPQCAGCLPFVLLLLLLRFRPRILIDVTHVDMTRLCWGTTTATPIMVAPTAMQRMAHPDGELKDACLTQRLCTGAIVP